MLEVVEHRVLVADDDPGIRCVIKDLLDFEGFETIEAGNGQEALDLLQNLAVGGILLDIEMPRVGGVEFIRTKRTIARIAQTPVIVMSAIPRACVPESLRGFPQLSKPFDADDLLQKVERTFFRNNVLQGIG